MDKDWYTGGHGYFNEDGQLFVVDRIKKLIKCYGFQVAPAELKGLLLSHKEKLDAVLIPFPNTKASEVPIAYVVRSPNSLLTEEDVQEFSVKQGNAIIESGGSFIVKLLVWSLALPN